jgi:predicted lipoprotein with Yx(FWY)xxD motif
MVKQSPEGESIKMKRIVKMTSFILLVAFIALLFVTTACSKTTSTTTSTIPLVTSSTTPSQIQSSVPASTTTSAAMTTSTTTQGVAISVGINIKSGIGNYLVDAKGMTLYWTTMDSVGQSNVTGTVLANWPVFYSASVVIKASLSASDFGTITRADGSLQTTYKGWPVYYYIGDKTAGDTTGQGLAGVWFAVDPAASGPVAPAATTTTPATTMVTTTTTAAPTTTTTVPPTTTTTSGGGSY